MAKKSAQSKVSRREALGAIGSIAIVSAVVTPLEGAFNKAFALTAHADPVNAVAGVDRVVMKSGKTYLSGWVGYGEPPRRGGGGGRGRGNAAPPAPTGPAPNASWKKVSGPGSVTFADPKSATTTATFSKEGEYVLEVTADNGETKATSTLAVKVELPPPPVPLSPVVTKRHT